jgi:prepilin-type N-terminal cleavage/methylation domain-containing protein
MKLTPPTPLPEAHGFTLVELAVVLIVVALLLGGTMSALNSQLEQQRIKETQRLLDEARESLIGFAAARGRLPCPDTDSDGAENIAPPTVTENVPANGQSTQVFLGCASPEGDFPFASTGSARLDGWGHRLRYRVRPLFTQSTLVWSGPNASGSVLSVTPGFSLSSNGNIDVQTRGDNPTTAPPSIEAKFASNLALDVPAVIISHGKNGYGAKNAEGIALPAPPITNVDELTNADPASTTKISRTLAQPATPCSDTVEGVPSCEFDDLVVWVSPNILFNRMIAAGRLP